jgi:hypothetical protein
MALELFSIVIMSANEIYLQKLIRGTISLLKSAPVLTVPQAMRVANFSSAQSCPPDESLSHAEEEQS